MKKIVSTQMRNFVFLLVMSLFLCSNAGFAQSREEINRLLTRAETAYNLGHYENALAEYLNVKQLIPDYPALYKAIADVHEKLGGEGGLQMAINNYNHYLSLAPNAPDKNDVLRKIAALEYLHEQEVEKNIILDDMSGIWVSNNYDFIFTIEEVGNTGRFRITVSPQSKFYSTSIITETVNVSPDKNFGIRFLFADADIYIPSQAKYDWARVLNNSLNRGFGRDLTEATINATQAGDVSRSIQTAYHFDLRYNKSEKSLKGDLNIITNLADAQGRNKNNDSFKEITLRKEAEDIFRAKISQLELNKEGEVFNAYGKRLSNSEIEIALQNYPDVWKRYKRAHNTEIAGYVFLGVGIPTALIVPLFFLDPKDKNSDKVAMYPLVGGLGLTLVGSAILLLGESKTKILKKHSKAMQERNRQTFAQKHYTPDLSFGITASGNIGFVWNF